MHTRYLCYRDRRVHIQVLNSIRSFGWRGKWAKAAKPANLISGSKKSPGFSNFNFGFASGSNQNSLTQVIVIGSKDDQRAVLSVNHLLGNGSLDCQRSDADYKESKIIMNPIIDGEQLCTAVQDPLHGMTEPRDEDISQH